MLALGIKIGLLISGILIGLMIGIIIWAFTGVLSFILVNRWYRKKNGCEFDDDTDCIIFGPIFLIMPLLQNIVSSTTLKYQRAKQWFKD